MIFSSPRFFVFLVAVLAVLALPFRHELKKRILFVASCVFYAAWDYRYLALLLLVSVIDYYCAARIAATDDQRTRRRWVTFSIVSNLAILAYFKYYNFFVGQSERRAGLVRPPACRLCRFSCPPASASTRSSR